MERSRLDLLEEKLSQVENEILNISQQEINTEIDPTDIFSEPQGELWERVREKDGFEKYTNFTEVELVCLYHQLVPFIRSYRRRKTMPKITYADF